MRLIAALVLILGMLLGSRSMFFTFRMIAFVMVIGSHLMGLGVFVMLGGLVMLSPWFYPSPE